MSIYSNILMNPFKKNSGIAMDSRYSFKELRKCEIFEMG